MKPLPFYFLYSRSKRLSLRTSNISFRITKKISVFLPLFVGTIFSWSAFAATTPTIKNATGAEAQLCNILNWMVWVLFSVSVIMIFYAAYLYLFAGDDAEQITRAKKAIFYAALGILVGIAAKGFPGLVASIFGQQSNACS